MTMNETKRSKWVSVSLVAGEVLAGGTLARFFTFLATATGAVSL